MAYQKQNFQSGQVLTAQRLNLMDEQIAENAQAVKNAVNLLDGENGVVVQTLVPNLNLFANDTKYTFESSYKTFYIPVQAGCKYDISGTWFNVSSSLYLRYGFSRAIPANNVPVDYIDQLVVGSASNKWRVVYDATEDGFFPYQNTMIGRMTLPSAK